VRRHGPEPGGNVAARLVRRDVPVIARDIPDARLAIAIRLVDRSTERVRAGLERGAIHLVGVGYVEMEPRRRGGAAPGAAAADHHPRVADANFGLDAAGRAGRA